MESVDRNSESTTSIDNVYSMLYKRGVRIQDIASGLRQQWQDNEKDLQRIHNEQSELRPAYIRYLNLEEEAKRKMTRLRRLAILLQTQKDWEPAEQAAKIGMDIDLFDEIALWEAISEILRLTGEVRVVDLHLLLRKLYSENVSRQAIESALLTHAELFRFRRAEREKFVALK